MARNKPYLFQNVAQVNTLPSGLTIFTVKIVTSGSWPSRVGGRHDSGPACSSCPRTQGILHSIRHTADFLLPSSSDLVLVAAAAGWPPQSLTVPSSPCLLHPSSAWSSPSKWQPVIDSPGQQGCPVACAAPGEAAIQGPSKHCTGLSTMGSAAHPLP